jgi:hypothetical protein
MRGAGRAIAWDFARHHRFGLLLLAAYLAAFAVVKLWMLGPEATLRFDPPNGLASFLVIPVTIAFFYLVGVFTYGLSGDLAARESTFPGRTLTLPVKTTALAGWPMLHGAITTIALWIAASSFARWIEGDDVRLPWLWPGFLAAAWLAWMQALTWMPYGLRGVRVVAAIAWLVAVDAIVVLAIYLGASEITMVAMLAPQVPIAYAVACYAVARARRGDVPDWSFSGAGPGLERRSREAFRSASQAQAWLEWRRHGWTLPMLVAAVVPFELLLLFIPENDTPVIVFGNLLLVSITPPVMAALAAPAFGSFTTFAATRPLASVALVAAKLRVATVSTLLAWMLVVVLAAAALAMSGTIAVVVEKVDGFFEFAGPLRAAAVIALLGAALVASTWKNLVQSLCIGLTGRVWLVRSSVLLVCVLLVAIGPVLYGFSRSEAARFFAWDNLPWIIAALVCAKLLAAAWIAIRLHEDGVLSDRALVAGAATWLATVAVLYGLLEWLAAAPIFPFYFLAGIAILAVPLARVSAAPLALAWSRHR